MQEIDELRRALLDRLGTRLRDRNEPYLRTLDRIAPDARVEFLGRHLDEWSQRVGHFPDAESQVLTALFDLEYGLDRIDWCVQTVAGANQLRDVFIASETALIFHTSAIQRLRMVIIRARRDRLISDSDARELDTEVAQFEAEDPEVEVGRDFAAHTAFNDSKKLKGKGWARVSDRRNYWKMMALWDPGSGAISALWENPLPDQQEFSLRHMTARRDAFKALTASILRKLREMAQL